MKHRGPLAVSDCLFYSVSALASGFCFLRTETRLYGPLLEFQLQRGLYLRVNGITAETNLARHLERVGSAVLTVVVMKVATCWDRAPCSPYRN
jgi:hypothetical protein